MQSKLFWYFYHIELVIQLVEAPVIGSEFYRVEIIGVEGPEKETRGFNGSGV